ncbi:hypothetical protein H3N56_10280 [Cetobacterium sp. 2A]|uniref:hypothetical protein n=1 Tax=Cetobacterium sp. 2A TaxID=2754723 RepID=UPI00163C8329|nr:hypothetical protein [Cetobacterium sp. 2A]MBC2856827.1 hypothetical protein [Cetobacterium sp. 2A]
MMYLVLEELPLKFEAIYKKFYEKDNSYLRGGATESFTEYDQLTIYKRKDDICFCLQLGDNHIHIMYPYYSKFGFCPEYEDRVYKKVLLKDWEKAYKIMQDFEKNKIQYDPYYKDDYDEEKEERKRKKDLKKALKEVENFLKEKNIKYQFEKGEGFLFDKDKFVLNKKTNIEVNFYGDIFIIVNEERKQIDIDEIYTLEEYLK